MRKIILLTAVIFFALMSTTFAAARNDVGVVIVGGAEFKTDDYYKIIQNEIKPSNGTKVFVGNELQTRYKKYWLNNGYIGEQTPQKEDLIQFAAASGCGKIVCLIVTDTVDKQNSSNHRQKNRVSVQIDAYLCTPTNVVDVFFASDDETSKGSPLRARRGAFKKCLKEIGQSLNSEI